MHSPILSLPEPVREIPDARRVGLGTCPDDKSRPIIVHVVRGVVTIEGCLEQGGGGAGTIRAITKLYLDGNDPVQQV